MAFGDFTVSRAGTKWVLNSSGVLSEVAANVPAFEFNADGTYRGLLVEPAGTNLALHSRDLTQAAWVSTNMTAARTATGADGTANTGTTLTATAGNATELQAITSASSARVFSARVRRRTGTGTVQITQDNGATWTTITLTSTYQLFSTPAQTLTNPTVGFRIVTSGDAIDVDFCQAETGSVSTSPIVTAGSTANRVADSVTLTGASSLIGQTGGGFYVEFMSMVTGANPGGNAKRAISLSNGTTTARILVQKTTSDQVRLLVTNGTDQADIATATNQSGLFKVGVRYGTNDFALVVNGTVVGTDVSGTVPACDRIELGLEGAIANSQLNGHLRGAVLFTTPPTNATLQALTA